MRFRFVAYEAEQRGSSRTGRSDDLRPAAGCGGRKGLFRHLTGDRLSRLNHPIDDLQLITCNRSAFLAIWEVGKVSPRYSVALPGSLGNSAPHLLAVGCRQIPSVTRLSRFQAAAARVPYVTPSLAMWHASHSVIPSHCIV
jgi:hypothetical protein